MKVRLLFFPIRLRFCMLVNVYLYVCVVCNTWTYQNVQKKKIYANALVFFFSFYLSVNWLVGRLLVLTIDILCDIFIHVQNKRLFVVYVCFRHCCYFFQAVAGCLLLGKKCIITMGKEIIPLVDRVINEQNRTEHLNCFWQKLKQKTEWNEFKGTN